MTELELLQLIVNNQQYEISFLGVISGLLLAVLFAMAWGRNT
jgi:hypothetical protein